ncbi:FecR domain-containing protein [Spirosoma sp.]|uniref:FecR family protein n=1 Tax=Spirosoma sp. TaxID=1899569 RepID=UPI002614EFB9|nr:FecR domain-containing protein [Spirosoma sp.]MCX6213452.1 FecR domain-containing protein [Spirosoma sp.]
MTEQLLQRYFANQVTPDEARRVLDWLTTEAGQAYLKARIDAQFNGAEWLVPDTALVPDAEQMLSAIRERMEPELATLSAEIPVRRLTVWPQVMRWAAVLAGLVLLATGAFTAYKQWYPDDMVRQTAFGKISTLTLPDGSTVTLNGNSRLRYAPRWASHQTREVWLDGEGYFRVTHQQNHERFVVHLPNKLNIEVLGTQFNVMARQARAKVVLNTGKIRLDVGEQAKEKLVMRPGDLFYADVKAKVYYRKHVDAAAQAAWQSGKLTFDGTTLQEVAQMLKDTYGVNVIITDPALQRQTISGTIPNQSMQTILNGLTTLFDLHITQQPNQIIIQ